MSNIHPSNIHPEEALISAILYTREYDYIVKEGITGSFFHIYNEEFSFLLTYIRKHARVPSIKAFTNKFRDFRYTAINDTEHFCEEVRKLHTKALLTEVISDATSLLGDDDTDKALEVLSDGIRSITPVTRRNLDVNIIDNWEEFFLEVKSSVNKRKTSGSPGIPTSFETVDEVTGGIQPGQLWVIGARTHHGKSWSLVKIAVSAMADQRIIQFDSLEMVRREVSARVHTALSGAIGRNIFTNTSLTQGKDVDLIALKRFLRRTRNTYKDKGFYVYNPSRGRLTMADLEAQVERNKPDVVFIDHLALMEGGQGDWLGVAALTNALKQFTITHVPVVLAVQLNREAARGDPGIENLARGDSIGQDADVVILQRLLTRRAMEGTLVKQRTGESGIKFYMRFEPDRGVYDEVQDYQDWLKIREEDKKNEIRSR